MMPSRVLVVEDSPTQRIVLVALLRKAGYVVYEAPSAEDGLAVIAREGNPDLVMTDINLPGASGLDLCEQLKRAHGESAPPVALLAHLDVVADILQGAVVGADHYLLKPIEPTSFLARTRDILAPDSAVEGSDGSAPARDGWFAGSDPRLLIDLLVTTVDELEDRYRAAQRLAADAAAARATAGQLGALMAPLLRLADGGWPRSATPGSA